MRGEGSELGDKVEGYAEDEGGGERRGGCRSGQGRRRWGMP